MRLPRKKKKELKKAFDSLSDRDAIHAKAHILLSISRHQLKKLKNYPIHWGYVEECNEVDNETLSKLRTRSDR